MSFGFGAREPQPCFLHRVLGLAERAQHPVGDTPQVSAMGLESLRQPVVSVVHGDVTDERCEM